MTHLWSYIKGETLQCFIQTAEQLSKEKGKQRRKQTKWQDATVLSFIRKLSEGHCLSSKLVATKLRNYHNNKMMNSKVFISSLVVLLALMAFTEGKDLSKNNPLVRAVQLNMLLLMYFYAWFLPSSQCISFYSHWVHPQCVTMCYVLQEEA